MKTFSAWLKDKRYFSLLMLLITSSVIWFIGPYIAIAGNSLLSNATHRMGVIIILVLVWGLNNLRLRNQNSQNPTHTQHTPSQIQNPWTPRSNISGIELLQQNFYHALAEALGTQTNHLLQRTSLPCYLIIGGTKSGKSTLLANLDPEIKQPIIQDKYCNWWKIQNRIFLEYNDHLQHDQKDFTQHDLLWQGFLQFLAKSQRKLPLSGVLLTVNLQQLYSQSREEQETVIENIKQYLVEINYFFKGLPVHLLFTQSDLIAGFNEFFEDLGTEEREQLFGVVFNDVNNPTEIINSFEAKFDQLLKQLNKRLIWRLHQEHSLQKRAQIKDFPLQLEMLKNSIVSVIKKISGTQSLNLEGAYFVSCLQQGIPTDYLAKPLSVTFSNQQRATTYLHTPHNKRYFINHFFKDLVTKSNPQQDNKPANVWLYYGIYAFAFIVIASSGLIWYRSYETNLAAIRMMQTTLAENNSGVVYNQYPYLNTLEGLSRTLDKINHEHLLNISSVGLKQSQQIQAATSTTYRNILNAQFLPDLQKIVALKLANSKQLNPSDLYSTLKVYLMLGAASSQRNDDFIKQWFSNYWQQTLPKQAEEQKNLTTQLNNTLQLALTIAPKPEVVTAARTALQQIPLAQLSFSVLQDHYNQTQIKLFRNNTVFSGATAISSLFSAKNFNKIYHQDIPAACQEVINGNWVLGAKANLVAPSDLTEQVQNYYLAQYANTWSNLLTKISFNQPSSLPQLVEITKQISSNNSPLWQLLNTIDNNTAPNNDVPLFTVAVSSKFQALHNFMHSPEVAKLQNNLTLLNIYFLPMARPITGERATLMAAAERMDDNAQDDPITHVEQELRILPEPMSSWLNNLTKNSWQLMLSTSQVYLNKVWANQVFPIYQHHLDNRYPLFKSATQDADITVFTAFFAPKGTMDSFFIKYLRPFVDMSNFYWVWKTVDNQKLAVPQETLAMFIRAALIQKMFFPEAVVKPDVRFALTPIALEPGVNHFNLTIGNQTVSYHRDVTPQTTHLIWPTIENSAGLQFTNDQNKVSDLTEKGTWAWFRLLDRAEVETIPGNPREFKITFDLNGNSAKYGLIADSLVNPFIPGIINAFRCPDKL